MMKIYLVGENNKPYFSDECGVFFISTTGRLIKSGAWSQSDLRKEAMDPDNSRVTVLPLTGEQLSKALVETYKEEN